MNSKQKNILLLISLVALSSLSLTLFLYNTNISEEIETSLFKLADPKAVNQIVFDKAERKTELKFSGNRWMLNEKYEADRNLVDVLFATMAQSTPKRIAAKSIRDSVSNRMKNSGTKVTFTSGNNTQQQFYVWGDGSSITYFLNEEEGIPCVMVIPGYKVYVAGIFMQDVGAWRDKRIFNFNWRNFKELSAEFPRDSKQNFKVAMSGNYFSIVDETRNDTTALNNYLDAVSLISADAFYIKGQSERMDSLSTTQPIMTITTRDVSDQSYTLNVFGISKGEVMALAKWNDDFVLFNRRNISEVYKKRKDFIKE